MTNSSEHITCKLARVRLDDDENPTADAENRIADALRVGVRYDDVLSPREAYVHLFPPPLMGPSMVENMGIIAHYANHIMQYIFARIFPRCGVDVASADENPPNLVTSHRVGIETGMEEGAWLDLQNMQRSVCRMCHSNAIRAMHTYAPEDPNKRFLEVDVRWGWNVISREYRLCISNTIFGKYFPVTTNDSLRLP
jgi:hypothetical protein